MVVVTGDTNNQVLHFNRGDDVEFHFKILNLDGTEYTMQTGDYLTFSIREIPDPYSAELLLQVKSQTKDFWLRHDLTDELEVGMYSADCEIHKYDPTGVYDPEDPDAGYKVETVWPNLSATYVKHGKIKNWKNLCVDAEVTCDKHVDTR